VGGGFMSGMATDLELEGGVLDVEVAGKTAL
jgi:hypothetical protein